MEKMFVMKLHIDTPESRENRKMLLLLIGDAFFMYKGVINEPDVDDTSFYTTFLDSCASLAQYGNPDDHKKIDEMLSKMNEFQPRVDRDFLKALYTKGSNLHDSIMHVALYLNQI